MLLGEIVGAGGHAVCAVGFRESAAPVVAPGAVELQDAGVPHVYVHEDNLGPGVRFAVETDTDKAVVLRWDPPAPRHKIAGLDCSPLDHRFKPSRILAAVHEDLRVSPDAIHNAALAIARGVTMASGNRIGVSVSSRFLRGSDYLRIELPRVLPKGPTLANARLAIIETVPPMSLHVGLVRLGVDGIPLADVLFDTTETDRALLPFCSIVYDKRMIRPLERVAQQVRGGLGVVVHAF